jgi:hypothetical protein
VTLRERLTEALRAARFDEVEAAVAGDSRAVRILLGLTYQDDEALRTAASRGLGLAGRLRPRLMQEVARRLVWAMNDESGTYGAHAPQVLKAIAAEVPELLLPLLPDLMRLTADPALHDALVDVARAVAAHRPAEAARQVAAGLSGCRNGGRSGSGHHRSA